MGHVRGRERFREYVETFKRAMPDAREIDRADRRVRRGRGGRRSLYRHPTPVLSPPTTAMWSRQGQLSIFRFADVSRVRDGEIVAYHTYYDQLGLLTQLGLIDQAV